MHGGEGRFYLHPRNCIPPVQDIPKNDRKHVSRLSSSVGKRTTEKVLKLPIERRQIPFLWIFLRLTFDLSPSNMVGSIGEEALPTHKKALEALSAKKAAPNATASGDDDEVQFIRRSKRKAATVLANLNAKVFPSIPASLPKGDSFEVVQFLQGNLLQAMSQLFHLGKRMTKQASSRDQLDALTSHLRKEKDKVLAKEKEIRAPKLKLKSQDMRHEILRRRRSSR
ncbi:hypothetical protein F2Q68_00039808 [Brassica cretica]|uniref:Uncharacterized protein n=1 Tax=Brassica cretica TaxID=69181 RepID=A0A8S9MMI2_BRACR|nr:hypothetical protein F2Q68_00039808 [Brassica cretica]